MLRQEKGLHPQSPSSPSSPIVKDHRRVHKAVVYAAAQFCQMYPEWGEYFFETRFLLHRGLPIIERHVAHATTRDAIDLALTWAEEWPPMSTSTRRARVQAVTLMAAALLELVAEALMLPDPAAIRQVEHARNTPWRTIGIPLAYVQAHG